MQKSYNYKPHVFLLVQHFDKRKFFSIALKNRMVDQPRLFPFQTWARVSFECLLDTWHQINFQRWRPHSIFHRVWWRQSGAFFENVWYNLNENVWYLYVSVWIKEWKLALMYVWMYDVWLYVWCMNSCMYVWMHVWMYVWMHV